jgi:hypothetical protein
MRFNSGTLHGRDEQHHDQCKQYAVAIVFVWARARARPYVNYGLVEVTHPGAIQWRVTTVKRLRRDRLDIHNSV